MTTDIRERVAEVLHENLMPDRTDEQGWVWTIESPDDLIDALLEAFPQIAEDGDTVRAMAVREAASYLDGITKNGLISKKNVMGDLEAAAYRMERGMTARGNARRRAGRWEVVE